MANAYSTDLESGSSQYWSILDASQTNLDFLLDLSISLWVKWESLPSSGNAMVFVAKYNYDTNQRSYLFRLVNDSGTYKLSMTTSTNGSSFTQADVTISTPSLGTWYHYGATKSLTTFTAFVNGSSVGTGTVTSAIHNGSATFGVGAIIPNSPTDFLDGKINDLRVYSANIGGTDMGNLYSTPCSPRTSNLVSSWFSTNNDGNDLTGSNNLTNNNSATFVTDVAYSCGLANVKTWDGLALASVKTINGLAIASVKSVNGLA